MAILYCSCNHVKLWSSLELSHFCVFQFFMVVLWLFYGCFTAVLQLFYGCFMVVLQLFYGCFTVV